MFSWQRGARESRSEIEARYQHLELGGEAAEDLPFPLGPSREVVALSALWMALGVWVSPAVAVVVLIAGCELVASTWRVVRRRGV